MTPQYREGEVAYSTSHKSRCIIWGQATETTYMVALPGMMQQQEVHTDDLMTFREALQARLINPKDTP